MSAQILLEQAKTIWAAHGLANAVRAVTWKLMTEPCPLGFLAFTDLDRSSGARLIYLSRNWWAWSAPYASKILVHEVGHGILPNWAHAMSAGNVMYEIIDSRTPAQPTAVDLKGWGGL